MTFGFALTIGAISCEADSDSSGNNAALLIAMQAQNSKKQSSNTTSGSSNNSGNAGSSGTSSSTPSQQQGTTQTPTINTDSQQGATQTPTINTGTSEATPITPEPPAITPSISDSTQGTGTTQTEEVEKEEPIDFTKPQGKLLTSNNFSTYQINAYFSNKTQKYKPIIKIANSVANFGAIADKISESTSKDASAKLEGDYITITRENDSYSTLYFYVYCKDVKIAQIQSSSYCCIILRYNLPEMFKYEDDTETGGIRITGLLTSKVPDTKNIVVPDTINGKNVTTVGKMFVCSLNIDMGITLCDSITSIEEEAFGSIDNLNIKFSKNLKTIGERAFANTELSALALELPEGVLSIGDNAFSYSFRSSKYSDISIKLPDSITTIGNGAFSGDSSIAEIKMPTSLTTIGELAFNGCTSLKEINIPANVSSIGSYGSSSGSYGAFNGCSNLETVTFAKDNKSLTAINGYTFYGCSKLKSVNIPDSVTSIGDYAFYGTAITSLDIPDSVTSIGKNAFMGCNKLENIKLPKNISCIRQSTFANCDISSIDIPDTVTSIEAQAFDGCNKLDNVTLPATLTSLGEGAFSSTGLTSIEIPAGLTSIPQEAFYSTKLTSLVLPDNITEVGKYAFAFTPIKKLTLSKNLETIGASAFVYCEDLKDVVIPKELTSVTFTDQNAFEGCRNIPKGILGIGDQQSKIKKLGYTGTF